MSVKERISLFIKNLATPHFIVATLVALAIPLAIYLAPNFGHKDTLKALELNLALPLFAVQFIVGIVLFVLLKKDFRDWILGILPKKPMTIVVLAFTAAITVFAATQIEARHRVQSDESIFLSVAQNMYYNQQSGTCNQGEFAPGELDCQATSISFKTKGLSFLYLLGMPLFGTDLHWVFNMELLMLPLAILLMFLAILAWTKQPLLAFFAALLTGLQPTVLFQFRSMSVEPLYIFLSGIALLSYKWAYDRNTVKHWIFAALSLAFFAQTRQETIFCLLPFIIFAIPRITENKDFKAPAFFIPLSLFCAPVLVTISYFQGFGFQGGEFDAHGHFIEDLVKNWEIMTRPLKDGHLSNPFLTYFNYLFAAGLLYLVFRAIYDAVKGKKFFYLELLLFLALYHIQTYVILENVSGDFSIEINQRYSLVMLPSMAFLGALPVAHLFEFLGSKIQPKKKETMAFALAVLAALGFSGWTAHYQKDFNDNIMYNRNHLTTEEHNLLEWVHKQPEAERLFIYGRPWHFVGYGVSSIHYDQARRMNSAKLQALVEKYKGEVYYVRGLDCWDSHTYHKKAVEHRIASTCDVFEKEMDLDDVTVLDVTGSYKLEVKKFNGRLNFNPEKVIQVKDPVMEKASAEKTDVTNLPENTDVNQVVVDSLKLQCTLTDSSAQSSSWKLTVLLNGNKKLLEIPYQPGTLNLSIPDEELQDGYNRIQFVVNGVASKSSFSGPKDLAKVSKVYFNDVNGAIALDPDSKTKHHQDWGSFMNNKSIEGNIMTVNGETFETGFGIHAASVTEFPLDGKYSTFTVSYGLDDESLCSEGVLVEIVGDDKSLSMSRPFKSGTLLSASVSVKGMQKLTLKTHTVSSSIDCSHVDIIYPTLIP